MKKFSLFVLCTLMSVCLFTACSDDDDDNSIVGKWEYKSLVSVDIKTNGSDSDTKKITDYFKSEVYEDSSSDPIEFRADGTYIIDNKYEGTYTFSDSKLILTDEDGDKETFNAAVTDGVLKAWYDDTYDCQQDLAHMELNELIALGIGNPTDLKITSVIVTFDMKRK